MGLKKSDPVLKLGISTRAWNGIVRKLKIETIGELVTYTREEIGKPWGMGDKTLDEIENKLLCNGFSLKGRTFYTTKGHPVKSGETNNSTACAQCGENPTKEGHDACLQNLPGVKNACCGHGVHQGYIHFEDGRIIRGIFVTVETEYVNPEDRKIKIIRDQKPLIEKGVLP